eukprot:455833_1
MASHLLQLNARKKLVVHGFIRLYYEMYITPDIIGLCIVFYDNNESIGYVEAIKYPIVIISDINNAFMYELILIGKTEIVGEIIKVDGRRAYAQIFYKQNLMTIGDIVRRTNKCLSVELGPGLLGNIFDGMQRPLKQINNISNTFVAALDRHKLWNYTVNDQFSVGDTIQSGDIIGTVYENNYLSKHKILVPPKCRGKIVSITNSGKYNINKVLMVIKDWKSCKHINLRMMHICPVRFPRPCTKKIRSKIPLITGQRVLDSFFPMIMGGTCTVPGRSGSGKTVLLQSIAKYSNVDCVIFVNCGERGNEIAQMMKEFNNCIGKICIVVNTSNMAIAKHESVIYIAVTIAEYYRDQGLNVLLLIDSITRWVNYYTYRNGDHHYPSYPAYLGASTARIAALFERADNVKCLGTDGLNGSLSIIGTVSPAGGDFADGVVVSTINICNVFWGLDTQLMNRRMFPAVGYLFSFSKYIKDINEYWNEKYCEYSKLRKYALSLLIEGNDLSEIVQLVGSECLSDEQQLVLYGAKLVREIFLQQDMYTIYDYTCPIEKTFGLLSVIIECYDNALRYVGGDFDCKWVDAKRCCDEVILKIESAKMDVLPNFDRDKINTLFRRLKNDITDNMYRN